jgi:hypothetical protein
VSSAQWVIWWTAGSGLSGVTSLAIGAASDTVRPSLTPPAAATSPAGEMLLSAPRRSAGPPPGRAPQPLVQRTEVGLAERDIGHGGSVAGGARTVIV